MAPNMLSFGHKLVQNTASRFDRFDLHSPAVGHVVVRLDSETYTHVIALKVTDKTGSRRIIENDTKLLQIPSKNTPDNSEYYKPSENTLNAQIR